MAKEGFWMVRYIGDAGEGVGLLAFDTGVIAGVDILGGRLDGTYEYDVKSGTLRSNITWRAGVLPGFLAQTGEPISHGMTFSMEVDLPNELDTAVPTNINTPKGPLQATFYKIREFER